eukprot:11741885-Alexandrium_andersonii.AAC.1
MSASLVGSEMCIRDSRSVAQSWAASRSAAGPRRGLHHSQRGRLRCGGGHRQHCAVVVLCEVAE